MTESNSRTPNPCAETEAVTAVLRSYHSDQPILAAYFMPLDFTPPPGNWAQSELLIIAEVEGDSVQRYRPFSRLENRLMDKGIDCWMRVYTPAQIEKTSIPSRYQNLVA